MEAEAIAYKTGIGSGDGGGGWPCTGLEGLDQPVFVEQNHSIMGNLRPCVSGNGSGLVVVED
jgi:hypothetical protein